MRPALLPAAVIGSQERTHKSPAVSIAAQSLPIPGPVRTSSRTGRYRMIRSFRTSFGTLPFFNCDTSCEFKTDQLRISDRLRHHFTVIQAGFDFPDGLQRRPRARMFCGENGATVLVRQDGRLVSPDP